MYLNEYTRKADAEAARKYGDVQGRPNNMFYFSPIYYNGNGYLSFVIIVGGAFPMVVVSMLSHVVFGPNDHREEASLYDSWITVILEDNQRLKAIISISSILQHLLREKTI